MTIYDIQDKYLHHYKMVIEKGKGIDPILPFILMDVCLQLFSKYIKPLECRQMLKKYKNDWKNTYFKFNRKFFNVFSDSEDVTALIDLMDDYEEFIHNDMEIARLKIMDCMPEDSLEDQTILSICMMCKVIIEMSMIIWERMYKFNLNIVGAYKDLQHLELVVYNFMKEYHNSGTDITANNSQEVHDAMTVLCRHTISWLRTK